MTRQPSDATKVRRLTAELARADRDYRSCKAQRDAWSQRAIAAEREVTEWQTRFDLLLQRTKETPR